MNLVGHVIKSCEARGKIVQDLKYYGFIFVYNNAAVKR